MLPNAAQEGAQRAIDHLLSLQKSGGDFEGEMVWCTMILAQSIVVRGIIGRPYSADEKAQILKHFQVNQAADGSWGMHPESQGYVFFTTLGYVALRLMGVDASDPTLVRARQWIHQQPEGVQGIPTWGKFWLAILGLYEYSGLNAIPPELFILPEWLPFHPQRFYCHTRLIYLGIAYISGRRYVAPLDPAWVSAVRAEIYPQPYNTIPFPRLRHRLAASDVYVPISPLLRRVYDLLAIFERHHSQTVRKKALATCLERILHEQKTSRHQGISPVNGLLNTLSIFIENPNHPELEASLKGVEAWRWEDQDEGLRYVGARSNTWDTGFVLQALTEVPKLQPNARASIQTAVAFLDRAQMVEEIPDFARHWRDSAVGGWCFSDGEHRWPVSDCTAEAITGLLRVKEHADLREIQGISAERMALAARFILSRQNADGGFGTYERRRAGKLLEVINPSEMFGQCMTELSYIECTASSIAALAHFLHHYDDFDGGTIRSSIQRGISLIRAAQGEDGSWQGFWGINYTYAIFHVAKALRIAGVPAADPALIKAANWLKSKQRADGGWSEHYSSCLVGHYVEHPDTQAVMTSWALLGLMEIVGAEDPSIDKGVMWLLSQQQSDGNWPRQTVNGVFFGAAMLDYRLYHTYFPVWALTRYNQMNRLDSNVAS